MQENDAANDLIYEAGWEVHAFHASHNRPLRNRIKCLGEIKFNKDERVLSIRVEQVRWLIRNSDIVMDETPRDED